MGGAYADAEALLAKVISRSLRPPERMTVSEWADAHRIVTEPSPRPGPWSTALVPYLREPMDAYADPAVRKIVLMFAAQTAKTEALVNTLLYTIDRDPFPALWVTSTKENARKFNEQRLVRAIRASGQMRRHLTGRAWDIKKESIEFDTLTLNLIGSNSPGNLASNPVGRLFIDERDKFPAKTGRGDLTEAGAVELAYARLGAFEADGAKAIEASTPTNEQVGIHKAYLESDQRQFWAPCIHCGAYQLLRFGSDGAGGIRWKGGSGRDLSESALAELATAVRATATYECAACARHIEEHHKHAMISAGLWAAVGQSVETRRLKKHERARGGAQISEAVIVGEAPVTDVRGYQLSRLYSPFSTWGNIAGEFVELRGEVDQNFCNTVLGEPWRLPGSRGDEGSILALAQAQAEAFAEVKVTGPAQRDPERYEAGEVPDGALVLLGAIDVQLDHVWFEVKGYGEDEAEYLIDWGRVACPEVAATDGPALDARLVDDAWARVRELLESLHPYVPHSRVAGAGEGLRVDYWGMDAAYRTAEAYRFAQEAGSWVWPMMGQPNQSRPFVESMPDTKELKSGNIVSQAGVVLRQIASDYWRDEVFRRMGRTHVPGVPGGSGGGDSGAASGGVLSQRGAWRYPVDFATTERTGGVSGHEYARQVTAEHRIKKRVRGREVHVWEKRPGRVHNHFFDIEVMLRAMADRLRVREMTRQTVEHRWEKQAKVRKKRGGVQGARAAGVRVRG